jgi:hypothetical protein
LKLIAVFNVLRVAHRRDAKKADEKDDDAGK